MGERLLRVPEGVLAEALIALEMAAWPPHGAPTHDVLIALSQAVARHNPPDGYAEGLGGDFMADNDDGEGAA